MKRRLSVSQEMMSNVRHTVDCDSELNGLHLVHQGNTALHFCMAYGFRKMGEMLLKDLFLFFLSAFACRIILDWPSPWQRLTGWGGPYYPQPWRDDVL